MHAACKFLRFPLIWFFGLIAMTLSPIVLSDWQFSESIDAMTDDVEKEITTTNTEGHELTAYIGPDDDLWMTFSLNGADQFDSETALTLRVDKNAPIDLSFLVEYQELMNALNAQSVSLMRELGETVTAENLKETVAYVWKPKFINFNADGHKTLKEELISGSELIIRYYLFTGGYKDTSFSLIGFGEGLEEVLAN